MELVVKLYNIADRHPIEGFHDELLAQIDAFRAKMPASASTSSTASTPSTVNGVVVNDANDNSDRDDDDLTVGAPTPRNDDIEMHSSPEIEGADCNQRRSSRRTQDIEMKEVEGGDQRKSKRTRPKKRTPSNADGGEGASFSGRRGPRRDDEGAGPSGGGAKRGNARGARGSKISSSRAGTRSQTARNQDQKGKQKAGASKETPQDLLSRAGFTHTVRFFLLLCGEYFPTFSDEPNTYYSANEERLREVYRESCSEKV